MFLFQVERPFKAIENPLRKFTFLSVEKPFKALEDPLGVFPLIYSAYFISVMSGYMRLSRKALSVYPDRAFFSIINGSERFLTLFLCCMDA